MAAMTQRIIAEHAFRMIFAADKIADMLEARPRLVNDAQFREEHRQWEDWHQSQSALEARTLGFVPGHGNESRP